MTVRTDIELTEAGLRNRTEWNLIRRVARDGDERQRQILCEWAYNNLATWAYEELVTLCETNA